VERIEILRGPAPVTYGATSFVGVIHVVHKAAAASARYADAHGGSFGSGGAAVDLAVPLSEDWKSRASGDFDRQEFKDDRTSFTRGHALLRTARVDGASKTWIKADITGLRQDPASPHPREGQTLSVKTPLDANHNPRGAYMNDDRLSIAGGMERPVMTSAVWGATASFTHSAQRIFRGFLTDVSNTPNNASGFKERIDVNDVYADSHIIWPVLSRVRFMAGADVLFATGEAQGATFTYTAPLSGSPAPAVSEPSTLDKDAEDERRFLGAYASAEWRPADHREARTGQ